MRDAVAIAGLVLLGGGLWWIYPPAALVGVGGILMALAIMGVRRHGDS